MFNTRRISYLKFFFPVLFVLIQLASIAIAIAFPAFILLPFIISIFSATFSFATMNHCKTKTGAAFFVVLVALAILTWGTSSVITQFGFYGFMQILISGPLLLNALASLLTGGFFALYHYFFLKNLALKKIPIKPFFYLIRSLVPAFIMVLLALFFGMLILNIMPFALYTVLIPIPPLVPCGLLIGTFLGLIGVNQVWLADRFGRFFDSIFSAAKGKWRYILFGNESFFSEKQLTDGIFVIETDDPVETSKKECDITPLYKVMDSHSKIARMFLIFSVIPGKEKRLFCDGPVYSPRPGEFIGSVCYAPIHVEHDPNDFVSSAVEARPLHVERITLSPLRNM